MVSNLLAMYCKTSNSLKNYSSTFKNKFTPSNVVYTLDIYGGNAIIITVLLTR